MALQLELDASHQGACRVVVRGELDAATAPALDALLASLAESGTTEVAIDLGGLDFADSSGLGPVVRQRGRFRQLVLMHPSRPVRRVAGILHLPISTTPGVVEIAAVA